MSRIVRARIVRIVPAVLLLFGSHAAAAQESSSDTARWLGEIRAGVSGYQADVRTRAMELGRKIEVLGDLAEAADSVSPIAMGQSLTRARQKVEEARRTAGREPALGEPVPTVVDIVSQLVTSPPFGVPADKLRDKLFVEIGKLEEDVLRQAAAFQKEAAMAESFERMLAQIRQTLNSTAVDGARASLATRRLALKSN
jgi:primosomal replication protein N